MKRTWKVLLTALTLAIVAPQPIAIAQQEQTLKKEEIEQLVAPIALYPDSLIAQILMACTYPLEVVEAGRWVKSNPNLTGKALEDALQNQNWDASVKSLTAFPQVLATMNDKLDMTQKLGDAFLAQQKDVLAAIQQLRAKAEAAGNLKSTKEQTVSTAQESGTTVIKIEPAQPTTVYVPTYNPAVVYGAWPYPAYPPYSYYPPGYAAGAAIVGFTAGVIVGNALWGNCNWGRGDVNINVNQYNSFNRTNVQNTNWTHNSEHRRGVQYRDTASQQKFGKGQRQGADAREAFRGRAEQGRQNIARGGADQFKGGGSLGNRGAGERNPQAGGGLGNRGAGERNPQAGAGSRGGGLAERNAGGGGLGAGGGGIQRTSAGAGAGAFQGAGAGGQTRDFSNRGATSRASAASQGGGAARPGGGGGARPGGGGGGVHRR